MKILDDGELRQKIEGIKANLDNLTEDLDEATAEAFMVLFDMINLMNSLISEEGLDILQCFRTCIGKLK